jgi:hypothetical protein
MRMMDRIIRGSLMGFLILFAGVCATTAQTQEKMTIQANLMGTGTQLGRTASVNIHIDEYSTPADRKILVDAFTKSGQSGLYSALQRMSSKGRIRFASGGVGNDVKYIIELPSDKGRRFRMVTDRNMGFAELRNNGRSVQYSVGAMEVTITPDGKGTGRLLPACKLKLNKQKEIEIETWQNPWNLTIFGVSKD